MKKIQYLDVVKKSLLMTWKNRFLWFFGFLVFLGSAVSSTNGEIKAEEKDWIINFAQQSPLIFSVVVVSVLVLIFCLIVLKLLATAALIKSANNISVYSQSGIKSILLETKKYVAKLFLLQLLVGLIMAIIVIAMFSPAIYLFSMDKNILGGLLFGVAVIVVSFLLISTYFILRYAQIFLVLADVKIKIAIEMAYDLFEKNFRESLAMGLLFIGVGFSLLMTFLLLILIGALVLSPFVLLTYFVFTKAMVVIFSIVAILLIAEAIVFFSWTFAFIEVIWVLFFQQISLDKKDEKKEDAVDEKITGELPTPEAV